MAAIAPQSSTEGPSKGATEVSSEHSGVSSGGTFDPLRKRLLLPAWLVIGFFLVLPVLMMLVYSFLTKEFRGGVIWEFSTAAYLSLIHI